MQSEPIPEGWDQQPVKELVGINLEKVAFNPDKTLFLMFCMLSSSFLFISFGLFCYFCFNSTKHW